MAKKTPPEGNSPFNRTAQHDAKRAAILSTAAKLFNFKGSRATTLMDIAQSLGLTKTSLYYYVKTKEELIYQCYMQSLANQHQILDEICAESDLSTLEQLRRYFYRHFENTYAAHRGERPHQAALLEIASLKDGHRTEVEQYYIAMFKRLRDIIRSGVENGELYRCEPIATTRAMIGSLEWSFDWLRTFPEHSPDEIAGAAWRVLLTGFKSCRESYKPERFDFSEASRQALHSFDREEQHRLKQEAFFKAGTRFFNKKGFDGTSLDEIAQSLNVTKGAFYYHIKNKEDLLYNCYIRSLDVVEGIYEMAAQLDSPGLRKVEYACGHVFAAQNTDLGPLIRYNSITSLPIPRRKQILARTDKSNERFGEFLREGIADGSVRADIDAHIAQEMIAGAVNASMDIGLWRNTDNLSAAALDYFNVFFNGLQPPQTT